MIALNISSNIEITNREIAKIFIAKEIECQIFNTSSSVKNRDNKFIVEKGFKILIFDINGVTFREKIWDTLKTLLHLKCAFVKYDDEYMGCILNWPNVFVESKCINKSEGF